MKPRLAKDLGSSFHPYNLECCGEGQNHDIQKKMSGLNLENVNKWLLLEKNWKDKCIWGGTSVYVANICVLFIISFVMEQGT